MVRSKVKCEIIRQSSALKSAAQSKMLELHTLKHNCWIFKWRQLPENSSWRFIVAGRIIKDYNPPPAPAAKNHPPVKTKESQTKLTPMVHAKYLSTPPLELSNLSAKTLSVCSFHSFYLNTHLYERLPRVGGDHGLELPGGECVDVTSLRCHQEHHLGARQGGKLVCLK